MQQQNDDRHLGVPRGRLRISTNSNEPARMVSTTKLCYVGRHLEFFKCMHYTKNISANLALTAVGHFHNPHILLRPLPPQPKRI
jgi:hypothetical protein